MRLLLQQLFQFISSNGWYCPPKREYNTEHLPPQTRHHFPLFSFHYRLRNVAARFSQNVLPSPWQGFALPTPCLLSGARERGEGGGQMQVLSQTSGEGEKDYHDVLYAATAENCSANV